MSRMEGDTSALVPNETKKQQTVVIKMEKETSRPSVNLASDALNNQDQDSVTPLSVSPPGLHKKISNLGPEKKLMTNLPKRPPVDIEFNNLSYSVPERRSLMRPTRGYKTILKGVSGKFKSGELTAIMGPSGAGKSTLMNIMAGYRTSNLVGDITINGRERNLRKFRKMSCYIMQDDCLSPHLTVEEAMKVAADLKLGERMTQGEKDIVIGEILDTLGLTECKTTRSSLISGGQRKRLAIALELVNNPPVMFFDEPTSGLDSASCNSCITLLKELAREGRTIICTIHQPSARIFEKFDKLYVLAEGQTIYRGSTLGLIPFLSSMGLECPSYHNPADFVMEVASGEHGTFTEKLVTAVQNGKCQNLSEGSPGMNMKAAPLTNDITKEESRQDGPSRIYLSRLDHVNNLDSVDSSSPKIRTEPDGESNPGEPSVKREFSSDGLLEGLAPDSGKDGSMESIDEHCKNFATSSWTQFKVLFIRTFFCIMRDETLTNLRLLSHVACAFLIGALYWDIGNEASKVYNNAAMLFFCMLFLMFTAMMPTVMTFPLEMASFKREHLNCWYSVKAFYLAKTCADLPFQIIFPLIYVLIVYFMTAQPLDPARFFMFLLVAIVTSLVAQSLGLLIGAAVNVEVAVYLGPVTVIPILLFSGFFLTLNNIPVYMQWLSYVAYVRYGFEGTMMAIYGFEREKLVCSQAYCHFKYPHKFLEELALQHAVYWIDILVLFGFFVFLRVMGYFVLKLKLKMDR